MAALKADILKLQNRSKQQRGAAFVEFALVAGLLCLLLFGIIEMGLIFQDQALLGASAREAARSAAVGRTVSEASSTAVSAGAGLAITPGNVVLEKSIDGQVWAALGDAPPMNNTAAGNNNAAVGDLVRATVTYAHPLVTGFVFSGTSKILTAKMVMRRE